MERQLTLKVLENTIQRSILLRIKDTGGVLGMCADRYFEDEDKGKLFIYECAEHCFTEYTQTLWNKSLREDILSFTKRNKQKENT